MVATLERARQLREIFGESVGAEEAEAFLHYFPRLEGRVSEITVMFADIRGFTRRSAGEPPERAVALLNRFLSVAVAAIIEQDGFCNKFLGDGLMALFGVPRPRPDHADQAVRAGCALLTGLERLNQELAEQGQAPLAVGIGIHTGPALVGCIGAALPGPDGRTRMNREFTAIGETVNLSQRVEQLTKTAGGPILVSQATRDRLLSPVPLTCMGPHTVSGYAGSLVVYRVDPG